MAQGKYVNLLKRFQKKNKQTSHACKIQTRITGNRSQSHALCITCGWLTCCIANVSYEEHAKCFTLGRLSKEIHSSMECTCKCYLNRDEETAVSSVMLQPHSSATLVHKEVPSTEEAVCSVGLGMLLATVHLLLYIALSGT